MVLNNFLAIIRSQMYNGSNVYAKTMTGADQSLYFNYRASDFFSPVSVSNSDNSVGWKVQVGTNDTAPAATDYAIATTSLTRVNTYANNNPNLNQIKNITSTYRNGTQNAITINEVALSHGVNNSSNTKECIFFRKVLDTPVTINPGEQYSFTYTVSVS